MTTCRICTATISDHEYYSAAPAMTSLSTLISTPTEVHVCDACAHVQSPDLPDVQAFYDHDYKISLQSEGHDQLYELRDGVPLFRTAHQASLVLDLDPAKGAKVLDFGAAKATTLRAVCKQRPDLVPHVFDVSEDYRGHWDGWVAKDRQATYELPENWTGLFDLVTAHFVLEHVADPVGILTDVRRCLAPTGQLFFTVPDPLGNSGDLLVADHLNHFTVPSLLVALRRAGLKPVSIRQDLFRGAHVVVAVPGEAPPAGDAAEQTQHTVDLARSLLEGWKRALSGIDGTLPADRPFAIYGAGFYGTLIASRLPRQAACFLDRNPHLQGAEHLGIPVRTPEDCPADISAIYAGLNPEHAHRILPQDVDWKPAGARIVYLNT